jgi:ABC-2 type transport system permease protein
VIRFRAFLQRDLRIARTYRTAFAGQIIGLLLFVATFGVVASVVRNDFAAKYGTGYFAFAAVGVAVTGVLVAAMQSFSMSLRDAQVEGTLEAMLLAPAPHEQIVGLMGVWPLVAGLLGASVTIAVAALTAGGFHINIASLALVVPTSMLAFGGIGLLSAASVIVVKKGDPISVMLGMIGSLTAGAYAPIASFPRWLQIVADCNPMTYALEAWRGALLHGSAPQHIAGSLAVLATMAIVSIPLARIALRRALVLARAEGTLTSY